ncbi:MAG TPA: ATP-dependent DNA helicase RecG [Vicinamibacteria bacterium]|nr:ATP-dependent DNA helicase RecG [Vicinamibacteria bacterium]
MDLQMPVQYVKGIGPQRARALEKLGVRTAEDLLLHVPFRYEDRRAFARIAELRPGMKVSVSGHVAVAGLRRARRMAIYEIRLEDDTGRLKAIWFNQPFLRDVLPMGARVVLYGAVELDAPGGRQLGMVSPQYEVLSGDDDGAPGLHTGRIVPIYEKLGPLQGKALRRATVLLAQQVPGDLPDPLPGAIRARLGVLGRGDALRRVHAPTDEDSLDALNAARSAGHLRLILEELFLFQLGLARLRQGRALESKGIAFAITDATREAVKRVLPFHLTGAQKRVLREIADDMRSPHPMNRLLQGDVGSGKTVVALLAMLIAVDNGYQAAFMAPTEILAEQHFLSLRRLLRPLPLQVELLSAGRRKGRRAVLERVASGETHIAVGTHALIQEGVKFARLGLAVVDEQHRFGVLQREDLRRKGYDVDVLVMTATPIPRTLALTAYGDLDTSVIDERPPGRTPVRTLLRSASQRREVVELVRGQLEAGRQAYVVYPLVEESEKLEDVKAATQMAGAWAAALPGRRVALLHGRMKSAEKEEVMGAFARGESHVLVATTVIEVGVDVANATVMVIEHAERFGLAQLHQLRGRVGRGSGASTCVLLAAGRLGDDARERLETLARTDDGFAIAEKDLELRGPGDFFGTRQSGLPTFRVAHLIRDRDLLERARAEAFAWTVGGAPAPDALRAFLDGGGWERRFGLARVG